MFIYKKKTLCISIKKLITLKIYLEIILEIIHLYETFFSMDNNNINQKGITLKEETLQKKSDKRKRIDFIVKE